MSIDSESLSVQVGADTSSADQTLAQFSARASEQLASIETKIDGLGGSGGGKGGGSGGAIDDFFGKFVTFQAVVGAARAVAGFAETAVTAYAENERLGQSLETLVARELRNADATLSMGDALDQASPKAAELLKWNEQLAINSPFNAAGIAAAFRTAEGYGFVSDSADKTAITAKRLTQDLVDFAAGTGRTAETVNQVALALGQIEAKGKIAGQEVLQLVNAGIPVDQILAKAFNKTTAEIVALRENGMIPADAAVKAIAYSLENDFGGAAARQSGTVSGLLNSLQDLQEIGSRDLLGPAIKEVQPYLQQLVDTLNSPEGKANIEAIGAALGTIVNEELPAIITQGQEWYATVQGVYGVVKPTIDAYHEIRNIKIPGLGGEVGDVLGSSTITKFMTGGYLLDLNNQITDLARQYGVLTPAAAAANAATANGGGGSWGDSIQEQQQLALSTQASAEELAKFQGQLDKTGVSGQAAYEKLADSQAAFASAEQQRTSDHQAKLAGIEQSALDARSTAAQNFRDSDAERQSSYQERVLGLITTALRQESDAQATEQDRQSAASEAQAARVADLHTRASDRQAALAVTDATREQDYQTRRTDLATQAATQLADTQTREHDRQASAEQSYQDRVAQLVERGTSLQVQYTESAADRQTQAAERAAERQAQAASQLADRQQQYAQRVADLQSTASDTAQTNAEQFEEDKHTRLGDHQDRLSGLHDQLNAAVDAKQRASIQKQIDAETDRYAKQETKAQTSYDRQAEKAAKALARQLEQAAEAEARAEAQAAQQLAKQDAQAAQQLARQDAAAAQQLAKQQDQLTKEQAAQDKAYGDSEAKASAAYAKQLATQDAATAAQLAKLQDTHAKQVASDEARYLADIASLQKSFNAEVDGYSRSEAKQAQHLATEHQQRQSALALALADAQAAFDTNEQKAQATFDKQQKAADVARQKHIADENTAFARQERDAKASYDKQQASLDAALGKQLLAYTDIQVKMSQVTAQEADKRHALIAKEFGVDPAAAQGQFAAYLAQLSGGPGGGVTEARSERNSLSGVTISGGVTINLQAVSDPAANAAAIQAALLQLQNRNGGTGIRP